MKKFLKIYAAVLLLLFVGIPQAYAEIESKFINADIDDAKIGELYYELNTKTHKAAVVCKNSVGSNLPNNYGTSIDVPSTVKFLNPANYYQEEEFTVVEIAKYAFHCPSNGDQVTHLSIPSTVVYIGQDILYDNLSICEKYGYGSYYFDNYLVRVEGSTNNHALRIRPGTRIISERCIRNLSGDSYVSSLYFSEGKITLCGNINWTIYYPLRFIELWGTEIDGSFYENEGVLTINNYSGKIDYSEATYKSLNVMYITRDIARYHTSGKNAVLRDKVVPFHFKVDNLYYELLNKDEAVVVHNDSYSSLGKVVIPEKVTYNEHTFTVTTIDPNAFKNSSLTSVTIPATVKTISEGAFAGCSKLSEVNLPEELTTVGKDAFSGCTAIRELHLHNVSNIAAGAFKGCTTLTTLKSDYSGVINAHGTAFDGLNKANITVQVPAGYVYSYQADAVWKEFNIASNRYKVDGIWYEMRKDGVQVVKEKYGEGNYAELTGAVTIPKDVVIGGKYYTVTSIEAGAFQYAPFTSLDIRAQVTVIPEGCCFAMSNLENVDWQETVVRIEKDAFNSCEKLINANNSVSGTALLCNENLTYIGDDAFAGTGFSFVRMKSNVTTIGEGAFMNCHKLLDISISSSVANIGKYAFQNCTKLTDIYNYALTPQPFPTDMLYGVDKDKLKIWVDYGAINAYKTADGWKDYRIFTSSDEWEDYEGNYFFFWLDDVQRTAILAPDRYAESELKNYNHLGNIELVLPEKISKRNIEYTVTGIDAEALRYAPIKSVVLPASLSEIGDNAFAFSSIEDVVFKTSGHELKIGKYAFSHCANLKEVDLSGYCTRLSEGAFADCFALEKVIIPYGTQQIGKDAFSNCAKLADLQLGSSLTTIGESAFWNCTSLSSLTIPENVTTIGDKAFMNCSGLYEIYNLNNTPQSINANVFGSLTLGSITLYTPPTRKAAYEAAAVWKDFNVKELNAVVDGLYYRINPASKTAQLTFGETIPMAYEHLSGKVTVPATITYNAVTYTVTEVGNRAFIRNTKITEIVLPEGIVKIGSDCFEGMTNLTAVNIPSTVTSFDRFGVSNGIVDNDYNYTDGLLYIDQCLIKAKSTLSGKVTIKDGTRLIAGEAMRSCKEITEVSIPESVLSIGPSVFTSCSKLSDVNLPSTLRTISQYMFQDCSSLGGVKPFAIPQSVTEIERDAFGWGGTGCTSLYLMRIPDNVRRIGMFAFWSSAIKQLWLPAGIEEIKDCAFSSLDYLQEIHCAAPDPAAITLGINVFYQAPEGVKLFVPYGSKQLYEAAPQWSAFTVIEENPCIDGFYYILDSETHTATLTYEMYAEDGLFDYTNYSKLNTQEWVIPAQVAFENEVYAVTAIGDYAFAHTAVKRIILPEGIKSIGLSAFDGSGQLQEVILPSTLTGIGKFAFYECRALNTIYNNAKNPQDIQDKGVFADGTYSKLDVANIILKVPYGSSDNYAKASEWKEFNIQQQPICIDGVYYHINPGMNTAAVVAQYDNASNYASLTCDVLEIPAAITFNGKQYKVTSVQPGAFAYCKGVQVIALPEGLTQIFDKAFRYSGFMAIVLPSTLKVIPQDAFVGCEKLILLRNFATEPLAVSDFSGYTKQILQVPFGTKALYQAAEVWKDFIIQEMPVCVDGIYYSVDDEAGTAQVSTDHSMRFYNQLGEQVVIPETITVGENTYAVTSIVSTAFWNNTVLEKISLPSRLAYIDNQAFSGCTALKTVVCERWIPAPIDATVFSDVNISGCALFVHREAVSAYQQADIWKNFNIITIETPIMIAGQPVREEQYGKPLTLDGITGEVVVTANSVSLGTGASINTSDMSVPAIELSADGIINTFFISGDEAKLVGGKNPAIRVNTPLTLNINTHHQGDETTQGLSLTVLSESEDGAIVFENGVEARLNINSLGASSTNSTTIVAATQCIGLPPSAFCDIHAAGAVDLISNNDVCPIGVFNTSSLTLHSTTMVFPYGGEVKDEGIFDAFGNETFRLRLAPASTQSGKAYPVALGGITVTDGNKADILGDSNASYDPQTNTLSLSDAEVYDDYGQVLKATAGINLRVKGENVLSSYSGRKDVEVRPCVEVQGDLVILGDKTSELSILGGEGVKCESTYRMEVKRGKVFVITMGLKNNFALQADSLIVNAASLVLDANYLGNNRAVAWSSNTATENAGLLLQHANKTYGKVNEDQIMEFEIQDPLLFKVTVVADDDAHGTVAGGGWYEEGTEVTLTATANEGYKFDHWSDGNTEASRKLSVDDDYTLTAIFADKNLYTVTFIGFNDVTLGYDYVYEGQAATAPVPQEVEGYTFTGWDKAFDNVQSDLTVTALYKKNTYTVTFLGFDGETVLKSETVEYGESATAPEAPAVEHYTFTGWDTNDYTFVSKDLTVNAVYEIDKFNVIFVGFGGVTLKEEVVPYGGSATAPSVPFVEGYDFKGWDTDFTNVQSDLIVTALYESNVVYHTLSLAVEGNGKIYFGVYNAFGELQEVEATEKSYTLEEGSQFLVIAHADEGWQFSQWADGETKQQRAVTLTSDISLKAIFTQIPVVKEYTVTFLGFNDVLIASVKVKEGEAAQAPEAPAVEGYEFKGWDTDFTNVQSDLTVRAIYEKIVIIDYTPKNLKVDVIDLEGDQQISFSWNAVEGAASYELQLMYQQDLLYTVNTQGVSELSILLSVVLENASGFEAGTYTLSWQVRSLDAEGNALSNWATGEQFEVTVSTGSGVENLNNNSAVRPRKVLREGHVYIIMPDGREYDATGSAVK